MANLNTLFVRSKKQPWGICVLNMVKDLTKNHVYSKNLLRKCVIHKFFLWLFSDSDFGGYTNVIKLSNVVQYVY